MICTILFIPTHLSLMAFLFDLWYSGDTFMILWSAAQLFLSLYSLLLLFGSVPIQVTLIKGRLFINIMVFFLQTISACLIALPLVLYFSASTIVDKNQAMTTFVFQWGITCPSFVFLSVYSYFQDDLYYYLQVTYPTLMSISFMSNYNVIQNMGK